MRTYTVFAVETRDPIKVKRTLEELLGVAFSLHESDYFGEYWRSEDPSGSVLDVGLNEDPMYQDGDPETEKYLESGFPLCGVLVRVALHENTQTQAIQAALARQGTVHVVSSTETR